MWMPRVSEGGGGDGGEGFRILRSVWFHEDLLAGHGSPRGWVRFEIIEIWLWYFKPIQPISGWNVAPKNWLLVFDCSRFASIDICITLLFVHGYMVMVCVCVCLPVLISLGWAAAWKGWRVIEFSY